MMQNLNGYALPLSDNIHESYHLFDSMGRCNFEFIDRQTDISAPDDDNDDDDPFFSASSGSEFSSAITSRESTPSLSRYPSPIPNGFYDDKTFSSTNSSMTNTSYENYENYENYHRKRGQVQRIYKTSLPLYSNKHTPMRQLPCRTFLSCGACPYKDKCVFLHDYRLEGKPLNEYIRKSYCKENFSQTDVFFFPTMKSIEVNEVIDWQGNPFISQPYIVPDPVPVPVAGPAQGMKDHASSMEMDSSVAAPPTSCSSFLAELATFSVWNHFIDALEHTSSSVVVEEEEASPCNRHTGRSRLSVFKTLEKGESLTHFNAHLYR